MAGSTRTNIDDEQCESIEEHYKLIMDVDGYIDSKFTRVSSEDLPDWFDDRLFKKGQDYLKSNVLSMDSAYMAGLFALFLIPTISKILIATDRSSTPCIAFKRYFKTLLHVNNLHIYDFEDPKSKFWRTINLIRWKHSLASRMSLKNNGYGILLRDMILSQFSFVGYALTSHEMLSLTNQKEEREGLNHLWRVIGSLIGIPDRYNICRKNEKETALLCKILKKEVFLKNLLQPTDEFVELLTMSVTGMKSVDPLLDLDSTIVFFHEINGGKYEKEIGFVSWLNWSFKKSVYYCLGIPVIGSILRSYTNVMLRSSYWLYENYPILAWIKYGRKASEIKMYPYSNF